MPGTAITEALQKIIKSQRKVNALAHSLSNHVEQVVASGNVTEVYTLNKELVRILCIMERLALYFHELESVHVSRMKRAAAQKERWQVIN